MASFTSNHRQALLACCRFFWARISPAVFGSLFQGSLDPKQRRQLGAHYTSERDILKLLKSLFLDELRGNLDSILADRSTRRTERLRDFQKHLRSLRFFDPACGCGNFLILTYREIRRLENEVVIALQTIRGKIQQELNVRDLVQVDVDQFYGLEIEEWPVRIAEVGLWLTDHQCNVELAEALGQNFRRLPLKATPTLRVANALRTDWREFLPPDDNVFVLGNPPFVGKHLMSPNQSQDMEFVWGQTKRAGSLDYVTAWYVKAAEYIQGSRIRCAFVSTNSVTQGEQVGILWEKLFQTYHIKIHFAHRTFQWMSEARGKAHVHVVIIGFGAFNDSPKRIFDYEGDKKQAIRSEVRNISPYLMEGLDFALPVRSIPLCDVPPIICGNKPVDGGHLIIEAEELNTFLAENPSAKPYVRPFLSAEEFLNNIERWVLWLVDAPPHIVRENPGVLSRLEAVCEFRQKSSRAATRLRADQPALFIEIRQPSSRYIAIPCHSSEHRKYVPIAYFEPDIIIGNSCTAISNATLFHFGVITSVMHMAWMRVVCGRLNSVYRYSNQIVYNNFPWPVEVTAKDRAAVETAAQMVLDIRAGFPNATLADLYDPLAMPASLVKAHATLDRAVERCYRKEPFSSDRARVEYLFSLYERLTAP
jgi:hypothetical protein